MRADRALERLGGVATTAALLRLTSKTRIALACRRDLIVRDGRGRYSLPGVDEAVRAAAALGGVLSEDSAAQAHGWGLKRPPASPCITVARKRRLTPQQRRGLRVRYRDLDPDEVNGLVTRPAETVTRCSARLPFPEALAVADSAMREGAVTREELVSYAEAEPPRYRARCLRVALAADPRAANPFESVLRAIALEVRGLAVEPQVWVGSTGRADLVDERLHLVDERLHLVVEADSFEFHGRRRMLKRDCERYNAFVLDGYLVIRFAYEHVMHEPGYVRHVLAGAVALLSGAPVGQALDRFAGPTAA